MGMIKTAYFRALALRRRVRAWPRKLLCQKFAK